MNKTSIEYLTHTWNPIAMRCSPISEGCANCWHIRMANRLEKNPTLPRHRQMAYAGGAPVLIEKELSAPLRRKKPAIIGVQFMGDLFHKDIEWPQIDQVLYTCYNATQHTFLILTKRYDVLNCYFRSPVFEKPTLSRKTFLDGNIWIGVTIETQFHSDLRTPVLLATPASNTVRFVSIEPVLGPINLKPYIEKLDWVIVGAETGPRKRPAKSEWIMDIVSQCYESKTPLFMKPNLEPYWTGKLIQEFPK